MENSPQNKTRLCPICKKTFEPPPAKYRIFCSERCKLIDLGNWIDEAYVISGETVVEEETAEKSPE